MNKYNFYYDESEHSQKINHKTITADNYSDSFIAVVVGWLSENQEGLYKRYEAFELKYKHRQSKGELKSTTIKPTQLKNGFASLHSVNAAFLDDFLSLFDEQILIYYSVTSKIEYIVRQLFEDYENSFLFDMDAMKYSITKAIVLRQPSKIMAGLYETTGDFVALLKDFFSEQIEKDMANETLKRLEIEQYSQILMILDDVSTIRTIDWNYGFAFVGFKKFLEEKGIFDYSLTVDKEGDKANTVEAAKRVGLGAVSETDSMSSCGIRMADMLAGVIAKLLKALHSSLTHTSQEEAINKKILDKSWFAVNEKQLDLYKKMYHVAVKLNDAWYKTYVGSYSDDFVVLMALLRFMNHFKSVGEIQKNLDMQGEYFNTYCIKSLADHYVSLSNKLPIVPVADTSKDYFFNQQGAKVYFNIDKQPKLEIKNGQRICNVLSVGLSKEMEPMVTIPAGRKTKCYRIPSELSEWAMTLVGLANKGENLFPSKVRFSETKDGFVADIL